MADRDCTCASCGMEFKAGARGVAPTKCRDCRNPMPKPRRDSCVVCGSALQALTSAHKYCSERCKWSAKDTRIRQRGGKVRPRAPRGPYTCIGCGAQYMTRSPPGDGELYCTRQCCGIAKRKAVKQNELDRLQAEARRALAAEVVALARIARYIERPITLTSECSCGASWTFKNPALKKHMRTPKRCPVCTEAKRREQKKKDRRLPSSRASRLKSKTIRRARMKIAAESIDPIKVFERDRWRCHMCKRPTPRALRGSYAPNAPELDHIVSLAEGGSHTWGNVACACRECNGLKGAGSVGQLLLGIPA